MEKIIFLEFCEQCKPKNHNYLLYYRAQHYFEENLEISKFLKEFNRHKTFLKYFFNEKQYKYFNKITSPVLYLDYSSPKKERKEDLSEDDFYQLGNINYEI